jgi:organic hydroperoxide reductase OsmC/OhrA
MTTERDYHVNIRFARGYEFVAEFADSSDLPSIVFDEPPPLGEGHAPNAAAVLGAAVGDCLAASLAFCLRKAHIDLAGLTGQVTAHVARNERGRFRVSGIDVELAPEVTTTDSARLERCEALFEDFCMVTESVRQGIPVNVSVRRQDLQPASVGQ